MVRARFQKAAKHTEYRIENKLSKYDRTVSKNISKMSKRMTARMKPHTFDPFDLVSIIGFMCKFKLECDSNRIHERVALWLFHFFMQKSTSSALQTWMASKRKSRIKVAFTYKTATLTTYPQVINYLRMHVTDSKIADTKVEMATFTQICNKTLSQYARKLREICSNVKKSTKKNISMKSLSRK